MAADINQIIDPKVVAEFEKLNAQIIAAGTNTDKLIPIYNKLNTTLSGISKTLKTDEDALKKLNAVKKESESVNKKLITTEAKIAESTSKQNKLLLTLQKQQQKQLQLLKAEAAVKAAAKGSNEKLAATISLYEKRLATVNQTTAKGKAQAEKLVATIGRMNTKLTQQSSTLTKTKRNIGNYGSAMNGMGAKVKAVGMQFAGALGLTSAVFIFMNVLKGSFNTIREFTKENAVLAGVLGVTRKEVKELTSQAITLGAIYPVTATDVNKLQVSYARLGFTQSEIINLTEATIQGSIALNASLDETATLVGAMVKAFDNLGTQDSGHIIDVLTLATQRSSLSFESLKTAMPKVAAAANAMNIPLETVSAQLGIAHDATLDASSSGTSLRNIYLELSKRGLTMDEALVKINGSTNKLKTSYELFGKRAAITALALANNTEKTKELTTEMITAGNVAEKAALEQMNTLDGALKSVGSSWEKLILGMRESDGILSAITNSFAVFLDVLSSDEFKLVDLLNPARLTSVMGAQKAVLDFAKDANREELEDLYTLHVDKARAGEKFSQKIIDLTINRLKALEQIEIDALARKKKADDGAKIAIFALEDEILSLTLTSKEKELIAINEKYDKLVERAKKYKLDTTGIEVLRGAAILKLNKEGNENLNKDEKESAERRLKIQEDYAESLKDLYTSLDEELFDVNRDYFEDKWEDIADKWFKKVETFAEGTRNLINSVRFDDEEEIDNTALFKQIDEQKEKEREIEDQDEENKEATKQAAIDGAIELGNTLFNLKSASLQREFEAAAGNEKKQAEISKRLAQHEKKQALFNIGINTAQGIVAALASVPPNVPLSFIIGGIGAIQAGVVAATPIPEFAKGTQYASGGVSLVGEKGREIIQNPKGDISLVNNPALINLERGSKVLTNQQTEAFLNDRNILQGLNKVEKAIQRIPQTTIDRNGNKIAERYKDKKINYYNSKFRLN